MRQARVTERAIGHRARFGWRRLRVALHASGGIPEVGLSMKTGIIKPRPVREVLVTGSTGRCHETSGWVGHRTLVAGLAAAGAFEIGQSVYCRIVEVRDMRKRNMTSRTERNPALKRIT